MKILVLIDDYWHPGEVIERGLDFLKEDYELDFVRDAKDILTPEMIKEYPLIINAKMNQLNGANQNRWFDEVAEVTVTDLAEYVLKGGGYISLHAGNAYFWKDDQEYCEFNGCAFVTHPPRCDVEVFPFGTHPITAEVPSFTIRDEHYAVDHIAADAQIIMESTSEAGGRQIAGYVRNLGEGRLCSLIPGHILAVFENEEYRKIIRNAIKWCCREI